MIYNNKHNYKCLYLISLALDSTIFSFKKCSKKSLCDNFFDEGFKDNYIILFYTTRIVKATFYDCIDNIGEYRKLGLKKKTIGINKRKG